MARYSLFVLKVPLNTNKTNKFYRTICLFCDLPLNTIFVYVILMMLYKIHVDWLIDYKKDCAATSPKGSLLGTWPNLEYLGK